MGPVRTNIAAIKLCIGLAASHFDDLERDSLLGIRPKRRDKSEVSIMKCVSTWSPATCGLCCT